MKDYDCIGMIGHGDSTIQGAFYTADLDEAGEHNVKMEWTDVMAARNNRPFDCTIWRTCFSGSDDSTIKAQVTANYSERYRNYWVPYPLNKITGLGYYVFTRKLAKKIREAND